MKKTLAFIAILVLLVLAVACNKNTVDNETTVKPDNINFEATELLNEDNINVSNEETIKSYSGGGYIESDKYRQRYYAIPYEFVSIVDREKYKEWKKEVLTQSENDTNVMRMVRFIKYFNISKEVFEKTNLQMAKSFAEFNPTMRPMDYENQQTYEIYNADIIYTFDDEIINEYYLTPDYPYCADFEYEAAVRRGEYTSQTEEWVDIEALEAEIIAKYGEAEIVTEETPAESSEQIETTAEQTENPV